MGHTFRSALVKAAGAPWPGCLHQMGTPLQGPGKQQISDYTCTSMSALPPELQLGVRCLIFRRRHPAGGENPLATLLLPALGSLPCWPMCCGHVESSVGGWAEAEIADPQGNSRWWDEHDQARRQETSVMLN